MKKMISFFLAAVLMFFASAAVPVLFSADAAQTTDTFVYNKVKGCSDALYYNNIEKQTYSHFQYWDQYCAPTNWTSPIRSYLIPIADGYMTVIVPERNGCFTAEYYDTAFNYKNSVNVPEELPLFGGFTSAGGYYYILSGKENHEEDDSAEVFRITKYDTAWKKLGSASLYGANTTVPFEAGTARFAEYGKYLLIRTSHKMYTTPDGVNHQANVTMQLDTEKMEITDSFTDIANTRYGYVSHSFNQFIKVDNGFAVGLDHGDASPRKLWLSLYNNKCSGGKFTDDGYGFCSGYSMMDFPETADPSAYNFTGASVGGFEITDKAYIAAGTCVVNSADTNETAVFWSVLKKGEKEASVSYVGMAQEDRHPYTPQLVKINEDRLCLLFSIYDVIGYCFMDGEGKPVGDMLTLEGHLSDCAPIVSDGKIVWFTCSGAERTFYSLDAAGTAVLVTKTLRVNTHELTLNKREAPTCGKDGVEIYACKYCGEQKTTVLPSTGNHDMRYTVETPATSEHDGIKHGVCIVCGKTENIVLPRTEAARVYYGDTDSDGTVSASDARFILRTAVGLEECPVGSFVFNVSDMDGDGNITSADARLALRTSVRLEKMIEYKM